MRIPLFSAANAVNADVVVLGESFLGAVVFVSYVGVDLGSLISEVSLLFVRNKHTLILLSLLVRTWYQFCLGRAHQVYTYY